MRGIFDGRRRAPSDGARDDHGNTAPPPFERPVYAIVVLIEAIERADSVASALERARLQGVDNHKRDAVVVAVPPHRGVGFFSDDDVQPELDGWWAGAIPGHALPLYVIDHRRDLKEWIAGVDGHFYVATADAVATRSYAACAKVTPLMGADDGALAEAVARRCGLVGLAQSEDARVAERSTARRPATPIGFRRASLRTTDEIAAGVADNEPCEPTLLPVVPRVPRALVSVVAEASGSAAFFQPTDLRSAEPNQATASNPDQGTTQELISVLGDALRRLQGIQSSAPSAALAPDSADR